MRKSATVTAKPDTLGKSLLPSIATGQAAGLIMAVVAMLVFAVFLGKSPLYPVQVIGATVFGEGALQGFQLNALLAGLLLHQLGPALGWSLVFWLAASSLSIDSVQDSLILGLVIGIVSMVGPYLLVPAALKSLQGVDYWNREVPLFWDWAAHIVFGVSFGLYPLIKGRLAR